jgi:hypothetical protein
MVACILFGRAQLAASAIIDPAASCVLLLLNTDSRGALGYGGLALALAVGDTLLWSQMWLGTWLLARTLATVALLCWVATRPELKGSPRASWGHVCALCAAGVLIRAAVSGRLFFLFLIAVVLLSGGWKTPPWH